MNKSTIFFMAPWFRSFVVLSAFCLTMLFPPYLNMARAADDEKKAASENTAADKDRKKDDAAKAASATAAGKSENKESDRPVMLTEEALREFNEQRKRLEEKERLLEERERALAIQEKIIIDKLSRIEKLNKAMGSRLDGYKKESEAKIDKLVKIIEGMKPVEAAKFLENIDPGLAVNILSKIEVQRASKVLNMIDKRVSARLTEKFTGYSLRERLKEEKQAQR